MMFRLMKNVFRSKETVPVALCFLLALTVPALAAQRFAIVPTDVIYPGETISSGKLDRVEVTNPNLIGGYASDMDQVVGMLSTRTLLPGRTIPLSSLKKPYAVTRGSQLRIVFHIGNLTISAAGTPMDDANIGDVIRVRNLDSGQIVSGTVMADGTVQVKAK
ncbi:flagellar basal body P-ring formation protein FlgA [Allorhizobium sp. BGMRC 0089]|uniref:flagellar basal body P-ring formation chaperone FlgA n=1 Tax=Allorhizobium sonneratiae TaxID=2934936 RepID=UPI0020333AF3|nr:flagellar basal body P-ring formation chaperone FlgA [Allorhizobium sonneratiae]MCM2291399.1 flagellar basal body P-ring formation protein FlgA [Allorhizobium sonneratiae]